MSNNLNNNWWIALIAAILIFFIFIIIIGVFIYNLMPVATPAPVKQVLVPIPAPSACNNFSSCAVPIPTPYATSSSASSSPSSSTEDILQYYESNTPFQPIQYVSVPVQTASPNVVRSSGEYVTAGYVR